MIVLGGELHFRLFHRDPSTPLKEIRLDPNQEYAETLSVSLAWEGFTTNPGYYVLISRFVRGSPGDTIPQGVPVPGSDLKVAVPMP
jgi:hypothetical protein